MSSTVEVIINRSSGAGDKEGVRARLKELFAARGVEARISLAATGAEIVELARRAAARNSGSPVVAGGGDGTINAVASALVNTKTALGILPLGTLNHFAKDLRIPLDLDAAAQNVIDGHVALVDVGEVNRQIFLNNSSLGLYPTIVRQRQRRQERHGIGKWPAFIWAALTALRQYPFLNVRLKVDGVGLVRRAPFVFVGNNEYAMDSFQIGGRACLDAGRLSLYVSHRTGRAGLLVLALRALAGQLSGAKDFEAMCAREITVETRRSRLRVAVDGEVTVLSTPLEYRVRPRALRVVVPRNSDGGE